MAAWFVLSFMVIPLVLMSVDTAGAVRARFALDQDQFAHWSDDFEVMVPIYGSMRYLENIDYLAGYGDKVLICTTNQESDEFYADLTAVTETYGFRQFRGAVSAATTAGKRSTGGTVRDRLIRDGLALVRADNVVCIDADTTTDRPLNELVGCMLAGEFDMASVRLVPSNVGRWITRLQAHEYRVAMSLRKVAPWLVSGACHAARTVVHRDVMAHHSLFFQGNDIETGLIAHALGYRVGHVPIAVPTTVPDTLRSWLRQRLAWAGGEFRLFIVNVNLIRRHPLLWTYGAVIVILAAPLRWVTVLDPGWTLLAVFVWYLLYGAFVSWRSQDRWAALVPLYTAFSSLVLTPLGAVTYTRMAIASRNLGRISLTSITLPRIDPPSARTVEERLAALAAAARAADRDHRWPAAASLWCQALALADSAAPSADHHLATYEAAERACEYAERTPQALAVAQRAVVRLGDAADVDTLVRVHERLAYYLVADGADADEAFAALKIAIEFGERRPPTAAYVQALVTAVGVLHEQDQPAARNELLARAVGAAAELDDVRMLKGSVLPWVAYLRLLAGDVPGCLQALLQAWSLRPLVDDPMSTVVVAALLVDALPRAGRVSGVDAVANQGLRAVATGGLAATWAAQCLRRNVAAALIELDRAEDAAAIWAPAASSVGDYFGAVTLFGS